MELDTGEETGVGGSGDGERGAMTRSGSNEEGEMGAVG